MPFQSKNLSNRRVMLDATDDFFGRRTSFNSDRQGLVAMTAAERERRRHDNNRPSVYALNFV